MSLFTSFGVGVTGLHSAQTSINTASHNLANAQTTGYTRQREIISDLTYTNLGMGGRNALLQIGLGSKLQMTQQIRDQFLDKQYRLDVGRQSFYQVHFDTATEVYDLFGEMEGVEFLQHIEGFWNVLQEFQKYPSSIVNRELFLKTSGAFLEAAQNLSSALNSYQLNLNDEIERKVARINEIGEQINALNKEIIKTEIGTQQANDYRDARNLLMDELGELTYFTYSEDVNGAVAISIENAPLVSGGLSFHMKAERIIEESYNSKGELERTGSQLFKVVWVDNGCGDVYNMSEPYSYARKTDVGSLRGILDVRGDHVANYTEVPKRPKEEDFMDEDGVLDQDAYKAAMTAYKIALEDYNNGTGASFITQVQAQLDVLIHGIMTTINDIFCPNIETTVNTDIVDANGNVLLAAGTYKMLDLYKCPVGSDDNETYGEELFVRGGTPRYTIIDVPDGYQFPALDEEGNPILDEKGNPKTITVYQLYVYNEEDPERKDTLYTVSEVKMNQKLMQNYSYLPVRKNPNTGQPGAYDIDTFEKLLHAWDQKFAVLDPNTLTEYNFKDYYHALIGDLSTKGQVWQSIANDQATQVETTDTKRQNVAGVATDEELTELIKFQYCYRAASRYITVIDQMLEHLIMRLG